jgi:hypothetical protein
LDPLDEGTDEVGTGLAVPTEVVLLATAEETDVDGKAVQVVAAAVEVLVTGPEEPGRRAERGWLEKMESAQGPPQMSGESKQYQLQAEAGSWTVVGARVFPH